jgi:hypothetical protein
MLLGNINAALRVKIFGQAVIPLMRMLAENEADISALPCSFGPNVINAELQ